MTFQVVSGQGYIQNSTITAAKLTWTPIGANVSTTTLAAPAKVITVSSLDLTTAGAYFFTGKLIGDGGGGTIGPVWFANSDDDGAHYWYATVSTIGASVSGTGADSNNYFGRNLLTSDTRQFYGTIFLGDSGYATMIMHYTDGIDTVGTNTVQWKNATNLTSFTIDTDSALRNFGAGSTITVWKKNV